MEHILFNIKPLMYSGKGFFGLSTDLDINVKSVVDTIPDYFSKDFYGFNTTRDDRKLRQGIPIYRKYLIEGVSLAEGSPIVSKVSLFNSDMNLIKSIITNLDGKYKFENLEYNTYVIVIEDLSLKYNHSIVSGVIPVEQS